ncbi:MAG: hypothetical protein ACKO3F_09975 [Cyanobium sp.]
MGGQTTETQEPSPPPDAGGESVFSAHQQRWRQQSLEQLLAATREELAAMKQLMDVLPGIFERRFALRMEPLLAHRERLLSETRQLRHDLVQLQGQSAPLNLLMLPAVPQRQPRLSRALRHAFGLRRSA